MAGHQIAPVDRVLSAIHVIRGQRVMLDADLAALYGVSTKRLNEQVRRNRRRFPLDFMFQLTAWEAANLRSQIATSRSGHGGRRFRPHAFIEHGAVMLASVLNTPIAVAASLQVVRAFIHLRGLLATHRDLARKLEELERKYDARFAVVFRAIKDLMAPPAAPPRKRIGFVASEPGRRTSGKHSGGHKA